MLAYKQRSRLEIASDLDKKGFPDYIIEGIISDLSDEGWLDDRVFAKDMVLAGQEMNRGWSRIYADLRSRKVERRLAEEILQAFYDPEKEKQSIRFLVEKHLVEYSSPPDISEIDRLARRISRRGFPPMVVRDHINKLMQERYGYNGGDFLDTGNRLS